jgi:hypothetical protein
MAASKSLNTATNMTPSIHGASTLPTGFWSVTLSVQRSVLNTSIRPVPRKLQNIIYPYWCKHTTVAVTLPSSVRDVAVCHIQMPDALVLCIGLAYHATAYFAAASSSRMVVLTAGISPGSGQHIISAPLLRT